MGVKMCSQNDKQPTPLSDHGSNRTWWTWHSGLFKDRHSTHA